MLSTLTGGPQFFQPNFKRVKRSHNNAFNEGRDVKDDIIVGKDQGPGRAFARQPYASHIRATPTVLQILFDKCCYLPTPKTIWRGNKKDISKYLTILTWQKQNSTSSEDQRRSIRLPNCWIGDFESFGKKKIKNAKPICKTVGKSTL